jgi:flagellar protein FlgJ
MENMAIKPNTAAQAAARGGNKISDRARARPSAEQGEDHSRLGKACADFEALFVQQLFKTMRASVPESGLMDGGQAEKLYTSMMDQEISLEMAHGQQGAIGLAKQMETRLMRYMTMAPR